MKKGCIFTLLLVLLVVLTGCKTAVTTKDDSERDWTELTYVTNLEDSEQLLTLQEPLLSKEHLRLRRVALPEGDPTTALQRMMDAGTTPDLMLMDGLDWTSLVTWEESGALRTLSNKKLEENTALSQRTAAWSRLLCRGSRWYALPIESWNPDVGGSKTLIYCRADWARNLGVEDLSHLTWTDFVTLLRGYTYNDPDNNGASDTWGLTYAGPGLGGLEEVFYGSRGVKPWVWEDGTLVSGWSGRDARETTQWLVQFTREGLLDPNGASHTPEEALELFCRGYAGMILWDDPAAMEETWRDIQATREKAKLINDSVTVLALPENPYGHICMTGCAENTALALFGPGLSEDAAEKLMSIMNEVSSLAWALPESPAEDAPFAERCAYRRRTYYRPYQDAVPDLTLAMGSMPVTLVGEEIRQKAEERLSGLLNAPGKFDALWNDWSAEAAAACGDYTERVNEWALAQGLNPT